MNNLFFRVLCLPVAAVMVSVCPVLGQTQELCPPPSGVPLPPIPSITAREVEDGSASLRDFALGARDYYKIPIDTLEGALYFQCQTRQEGSPWRSGSTYLVQVTLDGRVYEHAKSMALSGRLLNPLIYTEILLALGVSPIDLANFASSDPAVAGQAFNAILATLLQEPDGAFDATTAIPDLRPGIPGASGHAAVSNLGDTGTPILLIAGFDLDESHVIEEELDHGNPDVTARDVVDRESLKAFVTGAGEWFTTIVETATDPAAISKARIAARDPNGPWRHGSVYLYVLDLTSNVILFHGAFPDRFEWRPLVATVQDTVTGHLILPQVIEAAQSSPEGGFVEYFFDDPNDATDDPDIPKLGYAREFTTRVGRPDGSSFTFNLIVGSGLYLDSVAPAPKGELVNISTRALVGTREEVMIGGFIIENGPRQVLVQALGPELANDGIANPLADPVLTLISLPDGLELKVNDNWEDAEGELVRSIWGDDINLADGSASSALVTTLDPGKYTAKVRGKHGTSGVALVEVYTVD